MTEPWNWRPWKRVSTYGRCVICKRRPADGRVPVYPGFTRATIYPERVRIEQQAWCRPCGQAVLDYHSSEDIWYSVTDGWLPKSRIPL